jgi:lysophospholipase L1-like esterase
MRSIIRGWLPVLLSLVLGCAAVAGVLSAADPAKGPNTTIPQEKDRPRHDGFVEIAKAGGVDLLFLGDSITDGWRGGGKPIWDKYWAPLKAANFGIGGDRTEHVIWRLRHGELDGIQPKLVVLMIGTNNGGDSAEDVALGIKTIIADIQERSPTSRILLLAIFPRGAKPDARTKNENTNTIISGYADNRRVVYLNINQAFLTADGTLSTDIMPDLLHPNEKGYQIWADAINDTVHQMLQEDPSRLIPRITKPSPVAKVAKLEEQIVGGKVGAGVKGLEKLADDKNEKNGKTTEAASASLAVITEWRKGIDAEITRLKDAGDVYAAAELAAGMATSYAGNDAAKAYQEQAAELKKDPAYAAGQAYQKLRQIPFAQRKDPRFQPMVEAFVKKYPDGYYAGLAKALVPKD